MGQAQRASSTWLRHQPGVGTPFPEEDAMTDEIVAAMTWKSEIQAHGGAAMGKAKAAIACIWRVPYESL